MRSDDALIDGLAAALNVFHLGWAFVFQCSTGLILEQWPSQDFNVALQIAALAWFEALRLRNLVSALASELGRSFFGHRTTPEPIMLR